MTAFLTLGSLSLTTPDGRLLFEGLTLAVGRERTGLVGRNGCGKSTLLRAIAGEVEPAAGSVQRSGSIGTLAQLADDRLTVAQALGVDSALARLRRLERGEGSLQDAGDVDWTLESRLAAALIETGLPTLPLDRRLASLSGGERTRVALARLLMEAPDVLLLDEPTNNLDADGREAVATLLQRWRGGVIVASHDRAVALIPGMAAREVAVAALGTVYAIEGGKEAAEQIGQVLATKWSLATALSLLAWYIFAPQCASTLAVIRRETGSWKWMAVTFAYMLALAYAASLATYSIAVAMDAG
jgi:ABC-type sugar transport system ATPase subunit